MSDKPENIVRKIESLLDRLEETGNPGAFQCLNQMCSSRIMGSQRIDRNYRRAKKDLLTILQDSTQE